VVRTLIASRHPQDEAVAFADNVVTTLCLAAPGARATVKFGDNARERRQHAACLVPHHVALPTSLLSTAGGRMSRAYCAAEIALPRHG
jgi:hypothetical protein